MTDFDLINSTLDDLLEKYENDRPMFIKTYPSLPIEIYKRIEKLSNQRLIANLDLCDKAKKVSDLFHKSIK